MIDIMRLTPEQVERFIHLQSIIDRQAIDRETLRRQRDYYDGNHDVLLSERQRDFLGLLVGQGNMTLGEDAIRAIEVHRWPGNVRELENCIKRTVIMADGTRITQEDIGLFDEVTEENGFIDLRKIRDDAERQAVVTALGRTNGNLLEASEMLGISRPTLYDLMHRLGLK